MEGKMGQRQVSFSWDIHWKCNYRCPYCWWHGRWEEIDVHNRYPGAEELIKTWKRIFDKYGEVKIEIAGGEPFAYPDFMAFLDGVLDYHIVSITTNLSFDVEELLERLDDNKLERLRIGATYHPRFARLDEFTRKIKKLKKAGLSPAVLYLAWPPQVEQIPELRKKFEDMDVSFSVLTFWGEHEGGKYPASYNDEERKILGMHVGSREGEEFQVDPVEVKGRLCNAGHTYGTIHPDGEVIRCGGGSWQGGEIVVGNIFDPDFSLWDDPKPCTYESCPCNEWAFLLVKDEK